MLIASFHWYQRQTCLGLYYILVPSESIGFHLFSVMLVYKRCAYITNCASTQRSTISRSKYEPLLQYLRPLRPITLGAKYSLFVPNTQAFLRHPEAYCCLAAATYQVNRKTQSTLLVVDSSNLQRIRSQLDVKLYKQ